MTDETAEPITVKLADRMEVWQLERLTPYANNAKTHPPEQVEKIAASIVAFGFNAPILVDEDTGQIVAGHGRLMAAASLGMTEVPVIVLDHLDESQRRAYVLADNRLGEFGDWDEGLLATELAALEGLGISADLVGWTDEEVAAMSLGLEADGDEDGDAAAADDEGDEDEGPRPSEECPARARCRDGETWELGAHRVHIGDSTDVDFVTSRLGSVAAVVTDPPYAIYGSATGVSSNVSDDGLVRPFFEAVLRAASQILPVWGTGHVFCDWRSWPSWWEASKRTPMDPHNCIVWDKGGGGLGSSYANCYELVGYFIRKPNEKAALTSRGEHGIRQVHAPNLVRHNRVTGADRRHNAAKPVAMLADLVRQVTDEGDTVADLFLGSGSTILACEQTGRVCVGIEIKPGWADVVIDRWQEATGGEARLAETGERWLDREPVEAPGMGGPIA